MRSFDPIHSLGRTYDRPPINEWDGMACDRISGRYVSVSSATEPPGLEIDLDRRRRRSTTAAALLVCWGGILSKKQGHSNTAELRVVVVNRTIDLDLLMKSCHLPRSIESLPTPNEQEAQAQSSLLAPRYPSPEAHSCTSQQKAGAAAASQKQGPSSRSSSSVSTLDASRSRRRRRQWGPRASNKRRPPTAASGPTLQS